MDGRRVKIAVGASALRTCLGDKAATLAAMRAGRSGLRYCDGYGMYAGLCEVPMVEGFTRFESLLIEQIGSVLRESEESLTDSDTRLIVSTTKGNVELLAGCSAALPARAFLYTAVRSVADYFRCANGPVVISNACISGVSAFVVARDMLLRGECQRVVVAGCDVLSAFITAGFASFKSIGQGPCQPYDAQRSGLTLGEAAGAVMLSCERAVGEEPPVYLLGGAISNDANHISGPSRTGDGLYYAMARALGEAGVSKEEVGVVNAHGTATRYNDDMESRAIALAGLSRTPVNSLKGFIGHTLGASGVVETIVSLAALREGNALGTCNYSTPGTPCPLRVSKESQPLAGTYLLKTASGFGGCNAAIVLGPWREGVTPSPEKGVREAARYTLPASDRPFSEYVRAQFHAFGESNPKFYKMSDMSKALYVSVEQLLAAGGLADVDPTRRAIVLSNRAASLDADLVHQRILDENGTVGASPSAFVYTLANVAMGEMCIRHHIQGDNTFFIAEEEAGCAERYACSLLTRGIADAVIFGRCEFLRGEWDIRLKLLKAV